MIVFKKLRNKLMVHEYQYGIEASFLILYAMIIDTQSEQLNFKIVVNNPRLVILMLS